MRPGVFALSAALFLAAIAGQNNILQDTKADTSIDSAITACAVQGEGCPPTSLDSSPGSLLSHEILQGACAGATGDLHVMRFIPVGGSANAPAVATWCT
jgi:hypothetical protein